MSSPAGSDHPETATFDLGPQPLALVLPNPDDRHRDPSTFGFPLSAADRFDLREGLARMLNRATPGRWHAAVEKAIAGHGRDRAIALAAGRWAGEPLAPRTQDYLPGDVCGLRAAACHGSMTEARRLRAEPTNPPLDKDTRRRLDVEVGTVSLVYDALPYFLPVRSVIGIAGSEPPPAELLGELRLPFPKVAVFFGADLAVPEALVGGEDVLLTKWALFNAERAEGVQRLPATEAPPDHIIPPVIALLRGQEVRVSGVVLAAGPGGVGVDDLAAWFTVTPGAIKLGPRRVDIGFLSSANVRGLALNLAAATAWGHWQPPEAPLELPDDPASAEFRHAVRRGRFRRREPGGAAAGVRVLDVGRMHTAAHQAGSGTHSSPVTHLRRGHWRRQRIGPRDDWRYEPRWIPPVVVNPGGEEGSQVTVYRLPVPPDTEAPGT